MRRLSGYISYNERRPPEKNFELTVRKYNPQNEMFWHFRTKCSFPKTKRTS